MPVYNGNGYPMLCWIYEAIKLLEHRIKIVEEVLEKHLGKLMNIDKMQCGSMPEKLQLMKFV